MIFSFLISGHSADTSAVKFTVFFCKSYFQDEQEESDTIHVPLPKSSEGKKEKAAQPTKKKKRKKTKKAENEDKPEQQGQTLINDTNPGDSQGKAVHV